jgi:putative hemolysin
MDGSPGNVLLELLLIFVLILINAFFAASEMAIISSNKTKLSILAEDGNEKAKLILKILNEPSRFLSTIQIGITLAGFFASASAATSISDNFSGILKQINIPGSEHISVIVITILISYITLVFGELFPKRVALQKSEELSMLVIKPIIFISKLTKPFVKLLTISTNVLVKVFGLSLHNLEEKISEEEIRSMIEVGEENGVINEIEKNMIDGIFEFDDTLAKEIMTPRTSVFALDITTPVEEMIDQVLEEQYSRIPVYENDIDNVIGVLYMKDLFVHIRNNDSIDISTILRPAYFVPETKNIDALFKELQVTNNHMAILIDEYGGFSGIATIEDLIEEVMGNIFDEYDEEDDGIKKIDSNTYIVDGLTSIDDINELLDIDLPSDDFDTIGGFVITLLGSIPKEDENNVIEYENITFKIEKLTEKRIEKLKICVNLEA